MLTPRHGIFPVLYDRAIYVPGGGTQAGYAVWSGMDILLR
jgi:hypothetical protein